ncbi:tyrosine-protein phosphatase non-receptor type 7-like isoform X1 [Crassostrea virginica]
MEIQKFENVNCEFRLLQGEPTSTKKLNEIEVVELAVLFATIILVLSITLLLLKRLNVLRKTLKVNLSNSQPPIREDEEVQTPPRPTFGDESNTIFLEEIVGADDISDGGHQILDVEYTNTIAHRVSVEDFVKYHSMRRQNFITEEDEFAKIPTGLMELYREAVKKDNVSKNRYRYVYPYDFCRVVLDTSGEEGSSDYINACYVEGFEEEDHAYIAAQGPFTPETIIDFWKMIWQENSSRVVMLTNLYEGDHMKCLKYWPDDQKTIGNIDIYFQSQEENEVYTVRQFTIKKDNEVKDVTQFHFTSWPDRGVPDKVENLLHFRNLVKNGRPDSDGPIIVHCSAGIGRTGTFIALDYMLEEGTERESLDVINCVSKLRQQRAHSIQTKEQYIFLYDALAYGLKKTEQNSVHEIVNEV